MIVTPNRRGHDANAPEGDNLEEVTAKANLDAMKAALQSLQGDAEAYYNRNQSAFNAWHSRWDGQTMDGRRWAPRNADEDFIFPWEGASDTRMRTCEKITGQHMTVAMFAIMNMKLQAKAVQPFKDPRGGEQGTQLLNWMFYTHMGPENRRELSLGVAWREAYGAAVLEVCWDQEMRMDYAEVNLPKIQDMLNSGQLSGLLGSASAQGYGGQASGEIEGGQMDGATMEEISSLIIAPEYEAAALDLVQRFSPVVTRAQAKKILKDLRELRFAEIPIPYVFKSRPRLSALRPMVDIVFPWETDNLQRARFINRLEWVTETELRDRIETHDYDERFVNEALEKKGSSATSTLWTTRTYSDRAAAYGRPGGTGDDFENKILLNHFYRRAHDRGVPVLECTVFHADIDRPAKHGPEEYAHGEYRFHEMRQEYHERPILTSRGIPEIAYTWEMELKAQRDAQTDRAELALKPPILAPYQDVLRIKQGFSPAAILPERRAGDFRFMQPPQYDAGSIQVQGAINQEIEEFFALFGANVDPGLKQIRQQQLADDILTELKPVVRQIWQLMQQYLPDAVVARTVGPLARPFHVEREEIQGAYEISATVDMRDLDPELLKEKVGSMIQLAGLDTLGLIDRTKLIRVASTAIDYSLADEILQDGQAATQKEVQEEQQAISRIIGSGLEEPLPQGVNYQLRLQTLDNTLQEAMTQNPVTSKKLAADPDLMKIFEKRRQFFQGQLQQQQNAQIGRMQTTRAFTNDAPAALAT